VIQAVNMNQIRSLLIVLVTISTLSNNILGEESGGLVRGINKMNEAEDLKTLGKAVSSVLQLNLNDFRIVTIVNWSWDFEFTDEINEIMKQAEGKFVVQVMDMNYTMNKYDLIFMKRIDICKGLCLMLYDSFLTFGSQNRMLLKKTSEDIFLIKYIRDSTVEDLAIQMYPGNNYLPATQESDNQYILAHTKDKEFIELLELNPYVEGGDCRTYSMVRHNRFSKAMMEWEKPLRRFTSRATYNGCPMDISYSSNQMVGTKTRKGHQNHSGIYIDILKIFAGIGNFQPEYNCNDCQNQQQDDTSEGKEPEIYYGNDFTEKLYDDPVAYQQFFNTFYEMALVVKEFYFVVPRGELYLEWEKLLLAYDEVTWILIVVTFAAAFAAIFFIHNFTKQFVHHFVFGRDVTTPSLNVISIFFGVGQVTLPGRNFARFLLALFTIWCLIFRTCYSGLLFEYLIGDGRKPEIKSIDELLERNFTYHMNNRGCYMLMDVTLEGR